MEIKDITIKDIAKIAGVSTMTVSRAINNEKYVKAETKDKVFKVISEYGYEPNFFAKSLKSRKSKTIGLIICDIENPYYSRLAKGVIDIAESSDYNVIVCNSKYKAELSERYINMLIKKGVDGVLIATVDVNNELINKLNMRDIPFVLVTRKLDLPGINYITNDDYLGGRIAAEYLVGLGHKKIFFLKAANVWGANERIRAFTDVLKENDIYYDDSYFSDYLENLEQSYNATKKFLSDKKSKDFTAIIGGNDFLAIGAMEAIIESGLNIPDDISLIGYDNLNITSILKVPLTTVKQPKLRFGELATIRIIKMIENHGKTKLKPQKLVIKPELVIRKSCKNIK
ncbi:MAG: LacI family transcriptional regulator [Actinobacteria bacterium]|nr:LacI family transcriptional regulator [Actinomycetota bacterium]